MLDLKKVARRATVVAEIMEGREKGNTEDLIDTTATIDDAELCTIQGEKGEEKVWAYTLEEYPNKFFFAGFVLKKIFDECVEQYGYEATIDEIRTCVLTVKYGQKKTKDGKRTVTTIEVL